MLSIVLFVVACLVLIVAGILLAKGYKKETKQLDTGLDMEHQEKIFNTKYDELTYLYRSGTIKEEEYKSQLKNLIN